jgi:3-oxoacyl-[acyl-carrier-protein] synthase III
MGWPGHTLSAALDAAATAYPDRPHVITDLDEHDRVLPATFGAGLAWGGAVVEWGAA